MTDVVALLVAAAADGHTWLPRWMVESALRSAGADAAAALARAEQQGAVVLLGGPDESRADGTEAGATEAVALADVAEAEELLAEGLSSLAGRSRLAAVVGPSGGARDAAVARVAADVESNGAVAVRLDDAERLPLVDALALVEDLPEEAVLLLAGDPDVMPAPGPGAVFADVLASESCPVVAAAALSERPAPLARLETGIRSGELLAMDPEDRTVVVVPVGSDQEAAHRVRQLVDSSIPRAFGLPSGQVAVLTLATRGPAGAAALAAAAPGAAAVDWVGAAAGRTWPAVVLVLPGSVAGALSRDVVLTGVRAATAHLSVVHGSGPALAHAVAALPHRPRRTRLAGLLRAGVAE